MGFHAFWFHVFIKNSHVPWEHSCRCQIRCRNYIVSTYHRLEHLELFWLGPLLVLYILKGVCITYVDQTEVDLMTGQCRVLPRQHLFQLVALNLPVTSIKSNRYKQCSAQTCIPIHSFYVHGWPRNPTKFEKFRTASLPRISHNSTANSYLHLPPFTSIYLHFPDSDETWRNWIIQYIISRSKNLATISHRTSAACLYIYYYYLN